jgi:tRNA pseudouridine55 synthase
MSFHGVLLVNKSKGMTSHDVVAFLRRRLKLREIGHAGTLDPAAEGLLVCLLGEATKISDYLLNGQKAYRARVRFGIRTDTLDLDGQVLEESPVNLSHPQVLAATQKLVGSFEWPVPAYSAVKIEGRKLYEHARAGDDIALPKRAMTFETVQFQGWNSPDCEVELTCTKGSFIRTWADQLGQVLGVPATLAGLVRTYSSPFKLDDALSLEKVEALSTDAIVSSPAFVPLEHCLQGMPGMSLRDRELRLLMNGQIPHELERRLVPEQRTLNNSGGEAYIRVLDGHDGQLKALLHLKSKASPKIKRVFKRP